MTLIEFFNFGIAGNYIRNAGEALTQGKFVATVLLASLVVALIAYALGSINFAIIISDRKYKQDIRSYGSKNAGMTNMIRTYGKKMGALTLLGDSMKAVIACLFGYAVFGMHGAYIAAVFSVLGHMFPVFFGFKGGKGVATAGFAILMTNPYVFLICIVIFLLIVLMSKYISVGSVLTMFIYPIVLSGLDTFMLGGCPYVPYALLIATLVIFKHKDNIKRLREGKENKFSLKKKGSNEQTNNDTK